MKKLNRYCAYLIIGVALWQFFRDPKHGAAAWAAAAGWAQWLRVTA